MTDEQPALPAPTASTTVDSTERAGDPREGDVRINRSGGQEFFWRGRWRKWGGRGE